MKIKLTHFFDERVGDFTILDSFNLGYIEQIGDDSTPIVNFFPTINNARRYITRLISSIHATGLDLSIINVVMCWHKSLMDTLDEYENNGVKNNISLKGCGKYINNFITLEFID